MSHWTRPRDVRSESGRLRSPARRRVTERLRSPTTHLPATESRCDHPPVSRAAIITISLVCCLFGGLALEGPEDYRGAAYAANVVLLAIAVALVVGKALGITGAALVAPRLGAVVLPDGIGATHLWGIAALGGIGFTASLFIADLAYDADTLTKQAKVGIFAGSLASAVLGALILRSSRRLYAVHDAGAAAPALRTDRP